MLSLAGRASTAEDIKVEGVKTLDNKSENTTADGAGAGDGDGTAYQVETPTSECKHLH